MIYIEEDIPNIINLNFQQEENNYGIIKITVKNTFINLEKITLYTKKDNNKVILAVGYFSSIVKENFFYIYKYHSIHVKKYQEFYKKLFEVNKNFLITDNLLDIENDFLYINAATHEISINNLNNKTNNKIILENYEGFLLEKKIEIFKKNISTKVNLLYPLIEIHQDLIFTINVSDSRIHIIYNILNNWTDFQKNRIIKLTYEKDIDAYIIKIPNILYTRKILEYIHSKKDILPELQINFNEETKEFQQEENIPYKEININVKSIILKPKTTWQLIKNIGFNSYLYNNPISNLNIILKTIPENLTINSHIVYNNYTFTIKNFNIFQESNKFYCEINCVLYENIFNNIEDLNLKKEDNQILENLYNINFEDVFFYDKDTEEVIFREKIYKDYKYKKSTII